MSEEKAKLKKTPAKHNPWHKFLRDSIIADKENKKPNGYHWFLWLYYLDYYKSIFPNIDFINIQKTLPDNHELKKLDIVNVISMKSPKKFSSLSADKLATHIKEIGQKSVDLISFFGDHFRDSINFSNFIFPVDVYFEEAIFYDSVYFENAIFKKKAIFKNAKFSSYTTFENAQFEFYAPSFYGAELNDEMFWTDIKLPKFEKIDDNETEEKYKKRIKDNENAYENLSTKLGNQKKYRDEYFFFRQELSCQQKLEESPTSGFAFRIYGLFSGYGYNIGRAVWCWFGHMVFWAGILFFFGFKDTATTYQKIACSALTSVSNAHSFLLFKGDRLDACYKMANNKFTFNLFWAGETILGVIFLFLVLLTLRTRFRLK